MYLEEDKSQNSNSIEMENDQNYDSENRNNKMINFIFTLLSAVQKNMSKSNSQSQLFLCLIFYTLLISIVSYYGGTLSCKF